MERTTWEAGSLIHMRMDVQHAMDAFCELEGAPAFSRVPSCAEIKTDTQRGGLGQHQALYGASGVGESATARLTRRLSQPKEPTGNGKANGDANAKRSRYSPARVR